MINATDVPAALAGSLLRGPAMPAKLLLATTSPRRLAPPARRVKAEGASPPPDASVARRASRRITAADPARKKGTGGHDVRHGLGYKGPPAG